jgi:succinate-semialdehyde dehydrogenase/glutarate-semialdehyde dehydrogenase
LRIFEKINQDSESVKAEQDQSLTNGIATVNPTTGEVVRIFEQDSDNQIEAKLKGSFEAFLTYRITSFSERAHLLNAVASILDAQKRQFGRLMSLEMGKPIRAAIQEAEKCASGCRFYAEHGAAFLADEPSGNGSVHYQPLGPILAVMPWNFPFWQVFRFAAPALMAGNTALLKHASNVPQCALAIEDIFRKAGFPPGVFRTLMIGSGRVGGIIQDRRVAAVTLTGSVEAGRSVAAMAGKSIKKSVLELGGSDPFLVMPSADLEAAIRTAVQARTINNGQSCIAAKRFILHRQIAAEFERRFVEEMAKLKMGDPMNDSNDIGPLATREVLLSLQHQVARTVQMGARVLLGGKSAERPGFFFPPTVLSDIPPESPGYQEELFGPVACLFRADDIEQAIRLANDSEFGLGSCIWTNDQTEQDRFIRDIQAGLAFVNGMVASTPALPFGGVKQSGYGRELSHHGIREFVNTKTVVIGRPSPEENRTE